MKGNIKLALASIRGAKVRSALTILGIVIGVMSVMISVALAEGLKKDALAQVKSIGQAYVQIRPGDFARRDSQGSVTGYDLRQALSSGAAVSSLTDTDVAAITKLATTEAVAPSLAISTSLQTTEKKAEDFRILAVGDQYAYISDLKMQIGDFVTSSDSEVGLVVLGSDISERLFGGDSPLGQEVLVGGESFRVRGVIRRTATSLLDSLNDPNKTVFVSLPAGKKLIGPSNSPKYQQISVLIKPQTEAAVYIQEAESTLRALRGGRQDFTVLPQAEAVKITSSITDITSRFAAAIMSISLLVAGIGIMNIMLVTVTERTKEIGIRKAIGATNIQILGQFLIEALILGFYGGIIGVGLSWSLSAFVTAYTELTLTPTVSMSIISVALATFVGGFFGMAPALKAARKDPILALRGE